MIFKYVNSAVKPNFNENFVEKSICRSREQCMKPTQLDANVDETKSQLYPNHSVKFCTFKFTKMISC